MIFKMKQPLVFIIILNWNGLNETIECLESVLKVDYKNYKIVVVDNGSKDAEGKVLQTKYPNINILENKTNLGYAEGNNVGMKYALKYNPSYILFLNNDVIVDRNWLTELIKVTESNKKIGIVGPKIYYYNNPNVIWFGGGKIDYSKGPFIHIGQGEKDNKNNNSPQKVDYITGCSLLIKTSVLKKIGDGFNKKYFAYVEDIDLNVRVNHAGYLSYFVPSSKIWHKVSAATGGEEKANTLKEFLKARNLIFFIKTNFKGNIRTNLIFKCLFLKIKEINMRLRYRNLSIPIAIIKGIYYGFLY